MKISDFKIKEGSKFRLSETKTDSTGNLLSKEQADIPMAQNIIQLAHLQNKLYAQDKYGVIIIFQAMDTAGKDGVIKHVMTGLNPQSTHVHSFKQPSVEELNHDYLWRASQNLPERGHVGIFNRSYYEEVLVVKVHDLIKNEKLPQNLIKGDVWQKRYQQINAFEKYLYQNGYIILKFFLNISKEEQKNRLIERIDDKSKNWKFSAADIEERQYWDNYQKCYQQMIQSTSVKHAPWYVIPSDNKWFSRYLISEIILKTLSRLKLEYPSLNEEQLLSLAKYKEQLLNEQ